MKLGTLCVAVALGCWLLTSGCSRAKIDAVNLANEGDLLKKQGAFDGAIDKFEAAVQLDPTNHRILYKLALAHKKKEDWPKVASTLARATQLGPKFANYWFERDDALVQVAEKAKSKTAWEEAKDPLERCVEADPNSHCYFELALVMLFLDNEQEALNNYTKAIQHDPSQASYFPPLADLYIRLDYAGHAEQVLKEGISFAPDTGKAKFNMYVLLSQVHQDKGDLNGMVQALETANKLGGKENPEILFNLGSTYAILKPPKKTQAIQMLKQFQTRGCQGTKREKYKEQCEQSMALISKLGGPV